MLSFATRWPSATRRSPREARRPRPQLVIVMGQRPRNYVQGAAEGILHQDSCCGELEISDSRGEEPWCLDELGEQLREEHEEDYGLEEGEEYEDGVADELL